MSTLNITENSYIATRMSDGITEPTDKAIDKYKFHPAKYSLDTKTSKKTRYFFIQNSWDGWYRKRNQRH